MLPEDRSFPLEMIRASLMTGLYGLDGVDNYEAPAGRIIQRQSGRVSHLNPRTRRNQW